MASSSSTGPSRERSRSSMAARTFSSRSGMSLAAGLVVGAGEGAAVPLQGGDLLGADLDHGDDVAQVPVLGGGELVGVAVGLLLAGRPLHIAAEHRAGGRPGPLRRARTDSSRLEVSPRPKAPAVARVRAAKPEADEASPAELGNVLRVAIQSDSLRPAQSRIRSRCSRARRANSGSGGRKPPSGSAEPDLIFVAVDDFGGADRDAALQGHGDRGGGREGLLQVTGAPVLDECDIGRCCDGGLAHGRFRRPPDGARRLRGGQGSWGTAEESPASKPLRTGIINQERARAGSAERSGTGNFLPHPPLFDLPHQISHLGRHDAQLF